MDFIHLPDSPQLMTLTPRQAATFHTTAVMEYHAAIHMVQMFVTIPAIARGFQEEASDWKSVGRQIERDFPGITPHNWHIAGDMDDDTDD